MEEVVCDTCGHCQTDARGNRYCDYNYASLPELRWLPVPCSHWTLQNGRDRKIEFTSPKISRPDVLEKAIEKYGINSQTDMTIEEMIGLTKAIIKWRRATKHYDYGEHSRTNPTEISEKEALDDIAEELADTIIMIFQLFIMFGQEGKVQEWIDKKVDRMAERLSNK